MVYISWSLLTTYFSLLTSKSSPVYRKYFDLQGHRGGRGDANENTLPSFAWGLISGVTTLELDNGITKDGVPVVWHDESITAEKCQDTAPAWEGDPSFPYVGKNIANLTLAQLKTLDCGSKRLNDFPLQLGYAGTKISTLKELFEFARCADPHRQILWNIESKTNPIVPGATRGVEEFVTKQHAEFVASGYDPSQITYQSFDWRSLVAMKALDDRFPTSALIYEDSLLVDDNGISPWFGGLRLEDFPGATIGAQIANAAKSIKADVLSPNAYYFNSTATDPSLPGYIPFTTRDLIDVAHEVGLTVIPWTVNRHNIADQLVSWGVDGVITDYPSIFYRWAITKGLKVAPTFAQDHVLFCLQKHLQTV
ncbi:PLC-like phosphodiesterase [Amanita rubescens]|nr:PLC-like phosphodiesterase [Amanita rubescens]